MLKKWKTIWTTSDSVCVAFLIKKKKTFVKAEKCRSTEWWKIIISKYLSFLSFVFTQTQEREAKNKMREKAKELQRQKMEASRRGGKPSFGSTAGFGSSTGYTPSPSVGDIANVSNDVKPPSYSTTPIQLVIILKKKKL